MQQERNYRRAKQYLFDNLDVYINCKDLIKHIESGSYTHEQLQLPAQTLMRVVNDATTFVARYRLIWEYVHGYETLSSCEDDSDGWKEFPGEVYRKDQWDGEPH